ncbi:helix-turn-helix transcriptional regulator [uncultured Microbacterium sp.]|uniref:helix-turn-helix transcriptional regulator n=1 Tax=uncultured Microbacterium sp. TaxID=191216 RepID=UPI00345BEF61
MEWSPRTHEKEHFEVMTRLAASMRAARERHCISQESAAQLAGVSLHTYAYIERARTPSGGIPNPTIDTILRIRRALRLN